MPVIYINGIPLANHGRDSIERYYSPQRRLRDLVDAQDVEYEEIDDNNTKQSEHEKEDFKSMD